MVKASENRKIRRASKKDSSDNPKEPTDAEIQRRAIDEMVASSYPELRDYPAYAGPSIQLPAKDKAKWTKPIYKYIDVEHHHFLDKGSIKIGTLSSFRTIESARTDKEEGEVSRSAKRLDMRNPRHANFMRNTPMKLGPYNTISGINIVSEHPEVYCVCFADSPDLPDFDRNRPQAVYEISDPVRLALRLRELCPELAVFRCERVIYGNREATLNSNPTALPDPFLKPQRLKFEREVRICWYPTQISYSDLPAIISPADQEVAGLLRRVR